MKSVEEITGSRLYDYMMDFIKIGWRRAGTKEHHESANFILKKLNQFGFEETRLEPFEMLLYEPKKWELTVKCESLPSKEMKIECFPFWHTKASDKGGTEAELVHVGWGTPKEFKKQDVRGKIVLIDSNRMMSFYPTMDFHRSYERARKDGAIGLISIDDPPPNTIFAEYATRHQTLKDSNLESGSIPALHIGFESGNYLKALLQTEEEIKANLLLDTEIKPAMTDNLIGTLPGKKEDEIILVGTHIDSWFDGAIDNAGANAGFIELADFYSQINQNDRKKTMIFVGFAGHENGSIGVIDFAGKHKAWFNKITTFCMLDGFGSKGYILESPSRGVVETGLDESKALFTTNNQILYDIIYEAVIKHELIRYSPMSHVNAVMGPFSDLGPLVANNVPSLMIIGKGIFYHTIEDTADKVLPEQLERTTRAHVEILNKLHHIPTDIIKNADRKGINIPKKPEPSKRGSVYFNFNITPNPVVKGTTTLLYLTSYICTDRIILDIKWNIDKLELHAGICPYRFRRIGKHKVKLTLIDNYGNEYSSEKYVYVVKKT
ncbi:MAG: M28 family peptidase [Candidatus Helarchaeota archaeon]|nr:M28 family peptidase [Candidatus Helarchaeota archaeon]